MQPELSTVFQSTCSKDSPSTVPFDDRHYGYDDCHDQASDSALFLVHDESSASSGNDGLSPLKRVGLKGGEDNSPVRSGDASIKSKASLEVLPNGMFLPGTIF